MRDFVDTVKALAREEEAVGVVEIILIHYSTDQPGNYF